MQSSAAITLLQGTLGSLFPALHRTEEADWLTSECGESENNRHARLYRIARAGAPGTAGEFP
jgi:DNA-binding PadR family transcriptional regulator